MGCWKARRFLADSGTRGARPGGLVGRTPGCVRREKNDQGFGPGPATRGRAWSSWPAVISTVYSVHTTNGATWLNVRTSRFAFHPADKTTPPVIVSVTLPVFIGSFNGTTIRRADGRSDAFIAALADTTYR